MFSHSDPIVLFRMAERLTLTVVVLLIAAVVMVGFWRTVQKINVSGAGKLGLSGSVMFSTPVLVLLAIVGYAYVSLSNPVSLTSGAPVSAGEAAASDQVAQVQTPQRFLGSVAEDDAKPVSEYDRTLTQRRIRSLNCLAQDRELSPRLQDDLVDTKLALMAPVWDSAWGSFEAFAAWARATSDETPPEAARAVFAESHVVC